MALRHRLSPVVPFRGNSRVSQHRLGAATLSGVARASPRGVGTPRGSAPAIAIVSPRHRSSPGIVPSDRPPEKTAWQSVVDNAAAACVESTQEGPHG